MLSIDGRRYVTLDQAAAITYYSRSFIYNLSKREVIRRVKLPRCVLVCLSDLTAYKDARQQHRTKWQMMRDWWDTHVTERASIRTAVGFRKKLASEGITVSASMAGKFLARYRPYKPKTKRILEWLEEDASRRALSSETIRCAIKTQHHIEVSLGAIYLPSRDTTLPVASTSPIPPYILPSSRLPRRSGPRWRAHTI